MNRRALSTALILAVAVSCGRDPGAGTDVRPEQPPMRIVAGSVLAAEVLLEIAPRERIAAVLELTSNPRFSLVASEVEGLVFVGAEPEDLISVRPDLVITDAFTKPETLAILASAEVPVLRTATPRNFVDIADNIRRIGRACHREAEAEALVTSMNARLAELRARGAKLSGCEVMSLDGGLHTYGNGSLFDAVVTAAGAANLAAKKGVGPFRIMNFESVLAWCPEILIVDLRSGSEESERKWIGQSLGFHLLPAVTNDRILFVPSALLGTTSHRLLDTVEFVQDGLMRWRSK